MNEIFSGQSPIKINAENSSGEMVQRDGESFYRISNYDHMPPFFIAVVSGSDHWMFVSSNGGLTCGRRNPESALFPYYTDDKIHDAHTTTGSHTALLIEKSGKTYLWKPFSREPAVYAIERNLYKNQPGNRLIFEEINRDLGLVFSYAWSNSERFGFVKKSMLSSIGDDKVSVSVLDGVRNLLPYGATLAVQTSLSTLLDAYKQAETITGLNLGLYTLSSILTDRAEPCEALKATVVWGMGLDQPQVLLSEGQFDAFCAGQPTNAEDFRRGQRGSFYNRSQFKLAPGDEKTWYFLADVNQGPSQVPALIESIRHGIDPEIIEQDINAGTRRLWQLVGSADGCQRSSDALVSGRHFSNTLFNIMRGGTFYDDYHFPPSDFLSFVAAWNHPLLEKSEALLAVGSTPLTRASVIAACENSGDADLERIALEYLPLIFSRRHGDPSRPWNQFSIDIANSDGSDKLYFQGNWRDIFQNWEALAISYPEFIDSFIAKFVNASTVDGYNPYRISRNGIDWEILEPESPWSNIGYWGDHQINYLLKLLEFSRRYHPEKISTYLGRQIFVYARVPYRIKSFEELVQDPRNTVEFDEEQALAIARRVDKIGSDGKLVTLPDDSIYRVNLLEKLLLPVLVKIGNLVPGGGIWMNTQRPEWNDANNALVGYGLSMVTLCYLRRFLLLLEEILVDDEQEAYSVSAEVLQFFIGIDAVLKKSLPLLDSAISGKEREAVMKDLGALGEDYRFRVYRGFSGEKSGLEKKELLAFITLALKFMDHSISLNRREDGLYHAYNLIRFCDEGYELEYLPEMLEGQVAVLSSGYLDAPASLALLNALRKSNIYREDQNSYILYPDRSLPRFLEKNVIPPGQLAANDWLQRELADNRKDFVEADVNGDVHFNGIFRNVDELHGALKGAAGVDDQQLSNLCDTYEEVFNHRRFTGRSGSMYKYEGLGCIYWHMVSKLLLATYEVIATASENGADESLFSQLCGHFDEIKAGLGLHKAPQEYGAFPVDPYSHTPSFIGVQQPGMTGQVKEDVITRFGELGITVNDGEITFNPILLKRDEFISSPASWSFSVGGGIETEELEAGSLAFSLCGVPVIYRLAEVSAIRVSLRDSSSERIQGRRLGTRWSQSLFLRDNRVQKVLVDVAADTLR